MRQVTTASGRAAGDGDDGGGGGAADHRGGKAADRRERRARRRGLAAGRDRAADDRALAVAGLGLARSVGVGAGDAVALYDARGAEPPTAGLVAALQADGIRVLLPVTEPDLDLDWADAADPSARPLGRGAVGTVALVLAPGLAVDRLGTRLGQGGGCYDRALPRRAPGVPVVVVLHPGELEEGPLPRDAHDVPVDGVLTADGPVWLRLSPPPARG
jgi:5-formyltetrahydrofolate cyclo-ligase